MADTAGEQQDTHRDYQRLIYGELVTIKTYLVLFFAVLAIVGFVAAMLILGPE